MSTIAKAISALFGAVGMGLSGYLTHMHYKAHDPNFASICDINATFDCTTVANSAYSEFMGIPLALMGLGFYAAVIVLSLLSMGSGEQFKRTPQFIWGISGLAVLLSVVLGIISATAVGAFCLFCIGMYVVNFALFITAGKMTEGGFSERVKALDTELKGFYRSPAIYIAGALFVGTIWFGPMIFGADPAAATSTAALPKSDALSDEDAEKKIKDQLREVYRSAEVVKVRLNGQEPMKGNPQAAIEIIEFADFQCPFCSVAATSLNEVVKARGDQIKVIYKHYPLDQSCNDKAGPLHKNACAASRASICADRQGLFWDYHQTLFNNQKNLDDGELQQYASDLGLDLDAFNECRESAEVDGLVRADLMAGNDANVTGTPSVFINGRRMPVQVIAQPQIFNFLIDILLETPNL